MITQRRLKEVLHYDFETGVFRWLKPTAKNVRAGAVAGKTRKDGYQQMSVDNKCYYAHRLAWLYITGNWPSGLVDHIDGNPSNNKFSNLREATRSQNQRNSGVRRNNASGFRGVYWNKQKQKWYAQCMVERKRKSLGLYDSAEQASHAYEAFVKAMCGSFYRATVGAI